MCIRAEKEIGIKSRNPKGVILFKPDSLHRGVGDEEWVVQGLSISDFVLNSNRFNFFAIDEEIFRNKGVGIWHTQFSDIRHILNSLPAQHRDNWR